MRDSGDGAGDDQADIGTKNISREHEMALADNAREMLAQTEHALERLDDGTYGLCESCGNPIGKARMQAFPARHPVRGVQAAQRTPLSSPGSLTEAARAVPSSSSGGPGAGLKAEGLT